MSADTNPDAGTGSGLDDMPRYHAQDSFDAQTNAPSRNFRFDFSEMHFFVREEWQEVLAHDAQGNGVSCPSVQYPLDDPLLFNVCLPAHIRRRWRMVVT